MLPILNQPISHNAMTERKTQSDPMKLVSRHFFDLTDYAHPSLFPPGEFVWQALKNLKSYLAGWEYPPLAPELTGIPAPLRHTYIFHRNEMFVAEECVIEFGDVTKGKLLVWRQGQLLEGASVIMAGATISGTKLSLGKGVLIETGAFIKEPVIIGDHTEVRQGAYLRGFCLVGNRCVVGHVTEVKHAIFLDDAKAGHFAYLGDSILGNHVNLGAGTKLANLRFTRGDVVIKTENGAVSTGLGKLGAIMGDHTQTGCNAVTNPGTLLGKKSIVLPNKTTPSGYHNNGSIIR